MQSTFRHIDIFTILMVCSNWMYLWSAFGVIPCFPRCAMGIRLHPVYFIHSKFVHSFKAVEEVVFIQSDYHPSSVCPFNHPSKSH